jgi:serine/threonine-protein kinase
MKLSLVILPPRVKARLRPILFFALWLFGGIGLAGLVFGFSFYLAMRVEMSASEVQVPDLSGLDLDAAHRRVEALDLVLQVDDQRHDPATPSGHVLQQMPPAGASVRRGRKIKLVLSLGGKVLEVPDLIGQAARAVEIELRREGFNPGDEARVHAPGALAGTVIGQVPPTGTPAVPNTRIHMLVSEGPPVATWVMPDLTGLPLAQAERWVDTARFRRGTVRRVRMSRHTPGTVVGQLPLAGYPVRSNEIIELTVAR